MKKQSNDVYTTAEFIPVYDLLQNWDKKTINMNHLRFERISFSNSTIICYEIFTELDVQMGSIVVHPFSFKYVYDPSSTQRIQLTDVLLDEISKFIKTLILIDHIKASRESEIESKKTYQSKSNRNKFNKSVPGIYPPIDSASSGMGDCIYPSLPPFKRRLKDYD